MNYKNHVKSGLLLGAIALDIIFYSDMGEVLSLGVVNISIIAAGITLGSLLPDIDHASSVMKSNTGAIGTVASKVFSHRGFTHSLTFVLIVFVLFIFGEKYIPTEYIQTYRSFSLSTVFGILTHIFFDMIIGNGVRLFSPIIDKKIYLLKIKNNSGLEKVFNKLITVLCLSYFLFKSNIMEAFLNR